MQTSPLETEWERAAVKELTDILNSLCHGGFTSADDFCSRLKLAHESMAIFWGMERLEQQRQWQERVRKFERGEL